MQGYLKDVEFTLGSAIILTDMVFRKDHWLDKEGPFRQEWRNTDRYIGIIQNCLQKGPILYIIVC